MASDSAEAQKLPTGPRSTSSVREGFALRAVTPLEQAGDSGVFCGRAARPHARVGGTKQKLHSERKAGERGQSLDQAPPCCPARDLLLWSLLGLSLTPKAALGASVQPPLANLVVRAPLGRWRAARLQA